MWVDDVKSVGFQVWRCKIASCVGCKSVNCRRGRKPLWPTLLVYDFADIYVIECFQKLQQFTSIQL